MAVSQQDAEKAERKLRPLYGEYVKCTCHQNTAISSVHTHRPGLKLMCCYVCLFAQMLWTMGKIRRLFNLQTRYSRSRKTSNVPGYEN